MGIRRLWSLALFVLIPRTATIFLKEKLYPLPSYLLPPFYLQALAESTLLGILDTYL